MPFSSQYYQFSLSALNRALYEVPALAAWQSFDPGDDMPVDARYRAMPALTKADLRRHFPAGFVPRNQDINAAISAGDVVVVPTSGTTDECVMNLWHQPWWDASERASWQLHAVTRRSRLGAHREALLASARNVGEIADDHDLPMAERRDGRFLFLNEKSSPSLWTPALCRRMLDELARFQPAVLEANPAYLARLARFAAACNTRVFQPSIIVLTFELPTAAALRAIRTVFTSPLCSSYGSTEMGYVFMQCEQGRFHQNSAFCRVDFMPFAAAHGGPLLGRMLVTPFNHPWCQYVRFDVGDMLRLNRDGRCACGRDDGIVADSIDGRVKNAIFTDDGRLVSELRVDEALADCPGVFDYQIQQLSSARVTAHIVPADMHAPPHADDVSARLRALLGDAVKVQVDFIEDLPVAPSGKFRRVWSRIPFEVAALHRGDAVRG